LRPSIEERVIERRGLIILRSLTKIFAIPGLRLAYLAAPRELADKLKAQAEPWPINYMALEAGLFSLSKTDYILKTPVITRTLRERLLELLLSFSAPVPSDANFVLTKLKGPKAALLAHLRSRGILVRDCANFKGVGEAYLRFAVRPEADLLALQKALGEFYA
jgi:threonine-phosphate decarboxylase